MYQEEAVVTLYLVFIILFQMKNQTEPTYECTPLISLLMDAAIILWLLALKDFQHFTRRISSLQSPWFSYCFLSFFPSLCLFVCLLACFPLYMFVCLSLCVFFCLSLHLCVCPPVCLHVLLSICSSACMSVNMYCCIVR